jgi:hypothetical protein
MKALLFACATACAACASDTIDLTTGDYTDTSAGWEKLPAICDELPGHGGDTCRVIYANSVAQTYEGGAYPEGTVLVKEIHDPTPADGTGALQYVAIMRRENAQPTGFSHDGGWLFTYSLTPNGTETQESYCWAACHVAAPYGGAWLDYSK